MNNLQVEVLNKLREIVDEYEELITRIKYYKQLIRAEPESLSDLLSSIEAIYNRTVDLFEEYNGIKIDNDEMHRYIRAYLAYLKLISIPYTAELLSDIKNLIERQFSDRFSKEVGKIADITERLKLLSETNS